MSPRPSSAFAAPPSKRKSSVKRDTAAEAAEKAYVRQRDRGCVARHCLPASSVMCQGPIDVDHVRSSGGLGIKSPTDRKNMVCLCRHHHRLKTDWGRVWRPLLLAYLERVEVGE